MLVRQDSDAGPTWDEFAASLDDDFNTPAALALMHEWRRHGNHRNLGRALSIFGLTTQAPGQAPMEFRLKAEARLEARAARDFETSDKLRAEIVCAGWQVQDTHAGPLLVPA
jgi:cysteinyl-tRNA synthetase